MLIVFLYIESKQLYTFLSAFYIFFMENITTDIILIQYLSGSVKKYLKEVKKKSFFYMVIIATSERCHEKPL